MRTLFAYLALMLSSRASPLGFSVSSGDICTRSLMVVCKLSGITLSALVIKLTRMNIVNSSYDETADAVFESRHT